MFLYNDGRLQYKSVSFALPNEVMLGVDNNGLLCLQSSNGFRAISFETVQNSADDGIWGDWLSDGASVFEGPSPVAYANMPGEEAVWGDSRDLYYEVRIVLPSDRDGLDMLVFTLHFSSYQESDIANIKQNLVMSWILNSIRVEPHLNTSIPISNLPLSNHAKNCLKFAKIFTVAELLALPYASLLRVRNMGKVTAAEIVKVLHDMGYEYNAN